MLVCPAFFFLLPSLVDSVEFDIVLLHLIPFYIYEKHCVAEWLALLTLNHEVSGFESS